VSRGRRLQRLRCRWTRRRLQRYLDEDPSALLGPDETDRVRAHLARCTCCRGLAQQFRELGRLLAAQGAAAGPAGQDVDRVRTIAQGRLRAGPGD
jgi:predicted anti-sigma-YlaC factor YlaD